MKFETLVIRLQFPDFEPERQSTWLNTYTMAGWKLIAVAGGNAYLTRRKGLREWFTRSS